MQTDFGGFGGWDGMQEVVVTGKKYEPLNPPREFVRLQEVFEAEQIINDLMWLRSLQQIMDDAEDQRQASCVDD